MTMRGKIIAAKLAKKCKVSLLHIGSMEALKRKAMMLQYEFRVTYVTDDLYVREIDYNIILCISCTGPLLVAKIISSIVVAVAKTM